MLDRERGILRICVMLCLPHLCWATNVFYVSGMEWSTSTWNPHLPGPSDDVFINVLPTPGNVLQFNPVNAVTIQSLTLNESLWAYAPFPQTVLSHTLEITNGLTINGGGDMEWLCCGGTVTVDGSAVTSINAGVLDMEEGSTLTIAGNLTNSGNFGNFGKSSDPTTSNVINISGTLTNQAGSIFTSTPLDQANIGVLSNAGTVDISGAVNLTNQPSGLTDIVGGSTLIVHTGGTLTVNNTTDGLTHLGSIEGTLILFDQTTTMHPGAGNLAISSTGALYVLNKAMNATITVNGSLTNLGTVDVGIAPGDFNFRAFNTTLNVTNLPGGITDVVAGSRWFLTGTLQLNGDGTNNGLGKLGSVEGQLYLGNGQTVTVTPGGGTLAVSSSGSLYIDAGTALVVQGNVDNAGIVGTNYLDGANTFSSYMTYVPGSPNTLTVTGTFRNEPGASLQLGLNGDTTDAAGFVELDNGGEVDVNSGTQLHVGTLPVSGTGYIQDATGILNELLGTGSTGLINVTGAVSLNGLLEVTLLSGFLPSSGTFTLLTFPAGDLTGQFLDATCVLQSCPLASGSFNNGLEQWIVNYDNAGGRVFLSIQTFSAPVPEPTSLALVGLGLLAAAYSRKRSKSHPSSVSDQPEPPGCLPRPGSPRCDNVA